MGLFNKNKVSESEKGRAADIFAERAKQPAEKINDGVADRITGYNTFKGAETVKQQTVPNTPANAIDALRAERERRKQDVDYASKSQLSAAAKADSENRSAADDAITARKNLISSEGITPDQLNTMSAAERAAIEAKGMATLDDIVSGIKNKQFLTEVDAEIGEEIIGRKGQGPSKAVAANLSENEVISRTAAIRNAGFFTETEGVENKTMSTEKKLDQDLEELESAEKAIASFTNVGFRRQGIESEDGMSEKIEGEGE